VDTVSEKEEGIHPVALVSETLKIILSIFMDDNDTLPPKDD